MTKTTAAVESIAIQGTLDLFLEEWKEEATVYYTDLKEEYMAEIKKVREITADSLKSCYHFYTYKRLYSDEKIEQILNSPEQLKNKERVEIQLKVNESGRKLWEEMHTKRELEIARVSPEALQDILAKEVVLKKKKFIAAVEKKAGKILDASDLKIGPDGSINGQVVGELKTVTVTTIYAGGYNIQRLHYRLLVK